MKKYGALSDKELYSLTKRGDEAAFSELVSRHESFSFGVAFSVLHNSEDAADAVQDAFLRLWRAAGKYRGECEVKSWLYTLTKTAALDILRSRSAHAVISSDELSETGAEPEDPSPTPEEEAGRQELIREVRAAIDALPEAQREAIVMRELHGMSYIEIANATDSDIGTVKSRLSRARAALAEILNKSLGENFSP